MAGPPAPGQPVEATPTVSITAPGDRAPDHTNGHPSIPAHLGTGQWGDPDDADPAPPAAPAAPSGSHPLTAREISRTARADRKRTVADQRATLKATKATVKADQAARKLTARTEQTTAKATARADQATARAVARADKKTAKADERANRIAFSQAVGGSRGAQKAIRWTVGLVAAMLLVIGAVQVLRPPARSITQTDVQAAVAEQLAGTGYPAAAAESFAERFALVYYSWNQDGDAKNARSAALTAYLTDAIADGWNGRGAQTVVAGPYLAAPTTSTDANTGVVTLALQLDSGAWLYPMVPVYADGQGGLTIAGTPTLGTPPARAGFPGSDGSVTGDVDDAAARAAADVLAGFFTAWAVSDTVALERYITRDATPAARTGLGGAVQFAGLADLTVAAPLDPDAADRRAAVQVTWAAGNPEQPDTGQLTQTYLLTLVRTAGLWSVQDVTIGTPPLTAGRPATAPTTSG